MPSKADQYRKRAEAVGRNLKRRLAYADRAKQARKKQALEDMAANEDWLDGGGDLRAAGAGGHSTGVENFGTEPRR